MTREREAVQAAAPSAPPVMLRHQRDWVSDTADVAVWSKSRRIGASWCEAGACVLESASEAGQDSLYIGYSQDMTREFIEDCAMWAKAFALAASDIGELVFEDQGEDGTTRQIGAFRISFASGHKVLALSSRPRSIRGKQGRVVIDEAAFHDDLPGLLKAALAMLIWGGKVRVLSSHNGEDNPFNLLCRDIREGRAPYSLHETTFRDAVEAGLYDRVMLVQGEVARRRGRAWTPPTKEEWVAKLYAQYGAAAAEELDCIPAQGSGVYLPRAIVERAMSRDIPVLKWSRRPEFVLEGDRLQVTQAWIDERLAPIVAALPPGCRTVFGQDFGRSGDLSVTSVLIDEGASRWREAVVIELRNVPFDCQALIRDWLLDRLPLLYHAKFDARGNGESHAEAALQRKGPAYVECVKATQTWYGIAWPKYKAALEDRSVTLAYSEAGIADHRRVILRNGYPTVDEGHDRDEDGGQRHGDSAIARLLAWMATLREGQPSAGVSIEPDPGAHAPQAAHGRRRVSIYRRAA